MSPEERALEVLWSYASKREMDDKDLCRKVTHEMLAVVGLDALQQAVDKAHGAMVASAYVGGGVTEREAWQIASEALGAVVTQHTGQGVQT